MTMRRKMLSLAIAAVCFPMGSIYAQDTLVPYDGMGGSSVNRIGDYAKRIGDAPTAEDTRLDVRPLEFQTNVVDPSLVDTEGTLLRSAFSSASYIGDTGEDGASSQPTAAPADCATCAPVCNTCSPNVSYQSYWMEADSLLWFGQRGRAPALVTSSPVAGGLPILGGPDPVTVLAGGNTGLESGLLPGYRVNLGTWLDEDQIFGVGGRVFGIFGSDQSNTFSSTGVPSLGIPFYNASTAANDAYLVAFDAGVLGSNAGSITVSNNTRMISAEAYGLTNIFRSGNSRSDLLLGYMFSRLDDSLALRSIYTDNITNAVLNGTVFDVQDTFTGKNTFHGGEIGLSNLVTCGRWSLRSLTKVALGNVNQRVTVSGSYVESAPNLPVVTANRGLLAQSSNIGTTTRNDFAFIPEFGVKLGYDLNCRTRLNIGYTFIYWNNVVTGGSQIDPTIDLANALAVPTAPNSQFNTDGYWMQGLDLGITYQF